MISWQRFYRELEQQIDRAREENHGLALMMVNLRHFHLCNFRHGFSSGEAVVDEAITRIESFLKNKPTILRVAPDKLALILADVPLAGLLEVSAKSIVQELRQPFVVNGKTIWVSPCIGIALFPLHGEHAETLVSDAELALEEAGKKGLSYYFGTSSQSDTQSSVWQMEKDLHLAIANEWLSLRYQPKLDLRTMKPSAAEALMRWQLPESGLISPDEFIPLAEKSGSIHRLTEWAINTAVREVSELSAEGIEVSVAVNVSPASIYDPSLAVSVESAIAIWGLPPERLTLEVTESTLMQKPDTCFNLLSRIRDAGVRISIDDFGTGFSSLAYFKAIPADEIKIDQSFVRHMVDNSDDEKIVGLIIDLAHKFDLEVVAEGVEEDRILENLLARGCDYAQGFGIAKPMPLNNYRNWIDNYKEKRLRKNLGR